MKVILIADDGPYGKKGEVKEVKKGFARNYLFPKKIAIEATSGNLKDWGQQINALKKKEEKLREEADDFASRLQGVSCKIPVKVGEEEKIFGSVTSQTISDVLSQQGFDVSKKNIDLDLPLKTIGTHEVKIKLHSDVSVKINVELIKEDLENEQG